MACADVWLVASNLLQAPNNVLAAATPSAGLPQLQSEQFGSDHDGLRRPVRRRPAGRRLRVAARGFSGSRPLLTFVIAAVFDLLFLVVDNLPATVPVALALLIVEVGLARRQRVGGQAARRGVSARCGRSRPEDAIPPPAT